MEQHRLHIDNLHVRSGCFILAGEQKAECHAKQPIYGEKNCKHPFSPLPVLINLQASSLLREGTVSYFRLHNVADKQLSLFSFFSSNMENYLLIILSLFFGIYETRRYVYFFNRLLFIFIHSGGNGKRFQTEANTMKAGR